MQPRYEWQKGKDAWEEVEASKQETGQVQDLLLQRRWRYLPVVILFIGLIGASVFWFVGRRARNNTAAVEADILRTNSLIFQAVKSADVELLRSNMSGRDPGWVSVQEYALQNGLVFDRPWWGLKVQTSLPDSSQTEVLLNPEWNTAELVVPITYQFMTADGLTRTVELEQTLIYRRSRERWLLAPPDGNFWGDRLLFEGTHLTLSYPERDRETVERFVRDLDELVGRLCREVVGKACAADFRFVVRLYEAAPDVAAISSPVRQMPCARGDFNLPTPTLVGRPVDETGFEALVRGYQAEIAAIALTGLIYGADCPVGPMANVVLDYRLGEMGFRSWPVTVGDYSRLAEDGIHLEQVAYYVGSDVSGWVGSPLLDSERPLYVLIEFLVEVYGTSLGEVEGYIARERLGRNLYWSTLHNWTDGNFAANGPLEAEWERFLIERARVNGEDGPVLPDQDLRMVCYGGDITTGIAYPNGVLYELDVETGQMAAVFPLNHTDGYIISLPGDDGAVVAEQRLDFVQENARILLWKEGDPVVLFETFDNLLPVSFFDFRGRGEQLLVYEFGAQRYEAYLLAECAAGEGCNWSDFGGFPVVSPSGERFMSLLAIGNHGYEGRFFRPFGVGRLMTLTNAIVGKSPFWLSDERIGWIGEDGRTVMALTLAGENYPEEREVLVSLEGIDPLLALDEAATIESVVSRPNEPMDLIVTVVDSNDWASIYQVNILRRWVQRLKERAFLLNSETDYSFELSPEGRWLVISGNDLRDLTAYVHLFEAPGGGVHSFAYKMVFERPMHWAMDWSAGDEWLALPDNGYVRLIYPAGDYQNVIVPDGVGCSGAVWVD